MKISLDTKITDFKGKVMLQGEDALTMQDVLLTSVMNPLETDKALSGQKKYELYNIGIEIGKGKIVDFTAEEVVMLKNRIAQTHVPLIIGQVWNLLDPKPKA